MKNTTNPLNIKNKGLWIWLLSVFALISSILFIILFFEKKLYQSWHDPGIPYQTYQIPQKPDYNFATSWAKYGQGDDKASTITPASFIILPTFFYSRKGWNAEIHNKKNQRKINHTGLPNYAYVFKKTTQVYVPYYRQASLYAFLTNREDALRARKTAFQDVEQAFSSFLKKINPKSPIVLVGYGQGGFHLIALLHKYQNSKNFRKRLIVAYVIDYPLPTKLFNQQLSRLKPCQTSTQLHCVISWGSFLYKDKKNIKRYRTKLQVWDGEKYYFSIENHKLLCVNPLLWSTKEDYAPARLHKGGVAASNLEFNENPAILSKQIGAQCQDGVLLVNEPLSTRLRAGKSFGAQLKTKPYNLFYQDISDNLGERINAWKKQTLSLRNTVE